MERSSSVRVPRVYAAGQWLGLLAFGAALAGLHSAIDLRRYQNSDLYYLPALHADLAGWGGRLSEWKLPPAPYFFPDMALYFPVQAILRNTPLAFVLAGALQAVLWLAGCSWCVRSWSVRSWSVRSRSVRSWSVRSACHANSGLSSTAWRPWLTRRFYGFRSRLIP